MSSQIIFEALHEGPCVQMLHVGPYITELETVVIIHAYMRAEL